MKNRTMGTHSIVENAAQFFDNAEMDTGKCKRRWICFGILVFGMITGLGIMFEIRKISEDVSADVARSMHGSDELAKVSLRKEESGNVAAEAGGLEEFDFTSQEIRKDGRRRISRGPRGDHSVFEGEDAHPSDRHVGPAAPRLEEDNALYPEELDLGIGGRSQSR